MKMVMVRVAKWHMQYGETVKQRVRDADEARRLIQEVGNKGMVLHVESNGQ